MLKKLTAATIMLVLTAVVMLLLLTACTSSAPEFTESPSAILIPVSSDLPTSKLTAETQQSNDIGETVIFESEGGLVLEISNVKAFHTEDVFEDGLYAGIISYYECYLGAKVKILKHGMSDAEFAEDGISKPRYNISESNNTKTIAIDGELTMYIVNENTEGIYNRESSFWVIKIEPVGSVNVDVNSLHNEQTQVSTEPSTGYDKETTPIIEPTDSSAPVAEATVTASFDRNQVALPRLAVNLHHMIICYTIFQFRMI